ncbi:MAG: hypothetical protein U1F45_20620 [Burkholderiales bacterium]
MKRAQALGFSLADVAALLQLNDGTGHVRARQLAAARLAETFAHRRPRGDARRARAARSRLRARRGARAVSDHRHAPPRRRGRGEAGPPPGYRSPPGIHQGP